MKSRGIWAFAMAGALAFLIGMSLATPRLGDAQPVRESNESIANYAGAGALVEHETNLISPNCRAIYVATVGDVVVDMAREGTTITFAAVPAGTTLTIRIKRFRVASTATGVCLW